MNIEMLIAFTIGMIILAASPGPGVFATVSTSLSTDLTVYSDFAVLTSKDF